MDTKRRVNFEDLPALTTNHPKFFSPCGGFSFGIHRLGLSMVALERDYPLEHRQLLPACTADSQQQGRHHWVKLLPTEKKSSIQSTRLTITSIMLNFHFECIEGTTICQVMLFEVGWKITYYVGMKRPKWSRSFFWGGGGGSGEIAKRRSCRAAGLDLSVHVGQETSATAKKKLHKNYF